MRCFYLCYYLFINILLIVLYYVVTSFRDSDRFLNGAEKFVSFFIRDNVCAKFYGDQL